MLTNPSLKMKNLPPLSIYCINIQKFYDKSIVRYKTKM